MKLQKLLGLLLTSPNEAADDVLVEALRIGNEHEQMQALEALIRRGHARGLTGVLKQFAALAPNVQRRVVANARAFYFVLGDAGRGQGKPPRLAAMNVIAAARLGKLSYVLLENLRDSDEELSAAASSALLDMARWVNTRCRAMHRYAADGSAGDATGLTLLGTAVTGNDSTVMSAPTIAGDLATAFAEVMAERPEIESAVARALDWARTKHAGDLLRAALLLCDHPQSKTLAILKSPRHGGQASMVRKLQQPPAADHVEAFLLGASHGHLRTNFATAFAHITDRAVLDALLHHTHWLSDQQLRNCMTGVTRGVWWEEATLATDLESRTPVDAGRIAAWLVASGLTDPHLDARLQQVLAHVGADPAAKLAVLRQAARRPRDASCEMLKTMLGGEDETLARIAAREITRRRPPEFENLLLRAMTRATGSVRRVIGRSIGQVGFEHFWDRFERMEKSARRHAGRAMLKLLPDATLRLGRMLTGGTTDARVRALTMVQDLEMAGEFRQQLAQLTNHVSPRVRSKAVSLLVDVPGEATNVILEKVLADPDGRVRANAIEVLESKRGAEFVPMLTERARSPHGRERANAIKALHRLKIGSAAEQLAAMLHDARDEHRISALWTLRHVGMWHLLHDVGRLAQTDNSLKVRRYAAALLKTVVESMQKGGGMPRAA
ncbi:MAG TPA: HEAT repeat domain-containing protein [Tepidisphaeraceae bacterium]